SRTLQGIGVFGAQYVAAAIKNSAKERLDFGKFSLRMIYLREVVHGAESILMLFSERAPAEIQSAFDLALGFRVQAEIPIRPADSLPHRGFYQRLFVEFTSDAAGGAIQRSPNCEIRLRLGAGSRLYACAGLGQHIVFQKVIDSLCGRRFC